MMWLVIYLNSEVNILVHNHHVLSTQERLAANGLSPYLSLVFVVHPGPSFLFCPSAYTVCHLSTSLYCLSFVDKSILFSICRQVYIVCYLSTSIYCCHLLTSLFCCHLWTTLYFCLCPIVYIVVSIPQSILLSTCT